MLTSAAKLTTQQVVRVGARAVSRFLVTTDDGANYTAYTSEVSAADGTNHAQLDALNTVANGDWVIIECEDDSVNRLYIGMISGQVNANAATLAVHFWNGTAWTAVSNLSDGTASGGATLAQSGSVTFDYPSGWTANTVDSTSGYHLRVSVSAAMSATTSVDVCVTHGRVQLAPFHGNRSILEILNHPSSSAYPTYTGYTIYYGDANVLPGNATGTNRGAPLSPGGSRVNDGAGLNKMAIYADVSSDTTTQYAYVSVQDG